ncbi:hypothetical protein AVEN_218740-1 [Araneus ventricosus]|uniref:Uncharacterized protein n=1 Tax=Araneus ventricosus TaxID=182803 RepID=A0A4Y2B6R9_ARAVE|nr:hypothetical protein AVEN_218740-1 [Araneus ventricosus]
MAIRAADGVHRVHGVADGLVEFGALLFRGAGRHETTDAVDESTPHPGEMGKVVIRKELANSGICCLQRIRNLLWSLLQTFMQCLKLKKVVAESLEAARWQGQC